MDLLGTNRRTKGSVKSSILFLGTAAISGILFNFLLFHFFAPGHKPKAVLDPIAAETSRESSGLYLSSPLQWHPLRDKTLEELQAMVGNTRGFYARDWSLGLGWNNIRYIIEASLVHAQMLNRTLVLPSFIYARACEYELHVCAAFARMVNRGDAIGWEEWRDLPLERQLGWRIPMEVMLDVAHLRTIHPVVLVSEYLQMQGLPVNREWASGGWHTGYHLGHKRPTLYTIENSEYDPNPMVRVDTFTPKSVITTTAMGSRINATLMQQLQKTQSLTLLLSHARAVLASLQDFSDDSVLLPALEEAGWVVLHTWQGAVDLDYVKWVVYPQTEIAPRHRVEGFLEEFGPLTENVVVLKGETHLHRKPGGLRFTSKQKAEQFASLVLRDVRTTPAVRNLALRLIDRIDTINEGRLWQAAHMRRGDFVRHGWVMEASISSHLDRIMARLKRGREVLEHLHNSTLKTYDVPNVQPNALIKQREPPKEGDAIYIATDETDPKAIEYLRNNSVILFKDILTIQDRREFGWPLLYTDVVAVIEQTIMGIGAAYSYGHALSSFAGGVVNLRANAGWDPSTALID